jgi:hypothetical protein
MALVIDVALTFSKTQVIFTDVTGAYNASTNPTGYGAPNDAFTDFAHYAIIRKKNVNSVSDEVLALDAYSPVTDTVFTTDREIDGWYEGTKLTIRIWTAATYPAGTIRSHNGVIYEANTSTSQTPGAGAQWDVNSDLEDIETNSTVTVTRDGRVTAFNADLYWSKQIAANSMEGKCGICKDDRQKERLDRIYTHIQAVLVADGKGNNQDGEWNVLSLIQLGAVQEDE